jgi:K+-transporting ATPase ATPase A chain
MQQGLLQIALTLIILIAIAPVFGKYMARVYMGQKTLLDPAIKPLEEIIYKASNIRSVDSMTG